MGNINKYINQKLWYHGTTLYEWDSIKRKGVIFDYNKGNELDFGYGFYLTPEYDQAEYYIINLLKFIDRFGMDENDRIPVIIEFEFSLIEYCANPDYKFGVYNAYDNAFAQFVFHNRVNNVNGEAQHAYDIIFGVMSDSKPTILIQKYKNGDIEKNIVLEELKKSTRNKQLSLHNQKLCDIIVPKRGILLETGKELSINGYNASH